MLDDIYNTRILEYAGNITRIGRLAQPDATATALSRLCGSKVIVDVCLDEQQCVADFAHDVKACALGQASASIMARHVVGCSSDELRHVREAMYRMLKEDGPAPDGLWCDLEILQPVRTYKARHASTLLTFDATLEAVEKAGG